MAQRPELFAIRPDQIAGDGCVLALDMSTISGLHALKFDGVDDYVKVAHSASLNLVDVVSIEAWIKPAGQITADTAIVDKSWVGSYDFRVIATNRLYCNFDTNQKSDSYVRSENYVIAPNEWNHVVAIKEGTTGCLFVNGIKVAESSTIVATMSGNGNDVIIGNSTAYNRPLGGLISEVRIYNKALSIVEIEHNLLHNNDPVIDSLMLWITFDEGSGTTVADKSGKGNDGTIYGTVWEKQALEDLSGYRNDGIHYGPVETRGRYLRALSFDGVDDYVNCGNNASLDVKRITIMAWAYETKSGRENCIASKEGVYRLAINHGKPHFRIATANITWSEGYLDGNTTIPNNEWHHLAMTYDGSKGILYLDGVEDGSRAITGDLLVNTQDLWIGGTAGAPAAGSSQYFDGNIDVCIYNRVLSPDEIKARYLGARLLPQRTLTKLR